MEQAHELLNAIIIVHLKSDTGGELPPHVLKHIGLFTECLACLLSMYELILILESLRWSHLINWWLVF
jgi:hypothetical protein